MKWQANGELADNDLHVLISHLQQVEGFAPDLLEAAGLVVPRRGGDGFYDRFRHRVMVPICDRQGRIIGLRKVERALVCGNLGQGDRGYGSDGLKAVIVHKDTHTVGS